MYKLKTKSLAKKKFSFTGTGKLKFKNTGKGHNMTKRSKRQIRNNRKADYLFAGDAHFVKKYFMPYGA